jgi:hypothetical protein
MSNFRKSVEHSLREIEEAEEAFHQIGVDIRDEDEWQQLRLAVDKIIEKMARQIDSEPNPFL